MKKNNTTIQWVRCAIAMLILVFTATSALAISVIAAQSSGISRDIAPQSENNDRIRHSLTDVAGVSVMPDSCNSIVGGGKSISGTLTGLTTGDIVLIAAYNAHGDIGYGKTEVIAEGETAEYTISQLMETDHYIRVYSENYLGGFYGGKGEKLVPFFHQTVFVDTKNSDASGIDITMDPGHTISGRIEGLGENDFVTLQVTSDATGYSQRLDNVAGDVYTIRGVWPAQDYKVLIMSYGYIGGYYSAGGTGENADAVDSMVNPRNIDFTLSRGQKVSGTVNGLKENEIAIIYVKRESIHGDLATVFGDEAWTFVFGRDKPVVDWEVSGLKASDDFIAVFRPFYHVFEVRTGIDTSTDVTGVDFVMSKEEGNTMWGSIANAEAGQVVSISASSKIAEHGGYVEVTADADGAAHYEIKGLSNAPDYIVQASAGAKSLYYHQTVEKAKAVKVDMGSEYVIGINFDFSIVSVFDVTGEVIGISSDEIVGIEAWNDDTSSFTNVEGPGAFTFELQTGTYNIGFYIGSYPFGSVSYYDAESGLLVEDLESATPLVLNRDTDIGKFSFAKDPVRK